MNPTPNIDESMGSVSQETGGPVSSPASAMATSGSPVAGLHSAIHSEAAADESWVVAEANKRPLKMPLSIEETVAAAVMFLLGLITLANVLARYIFEVSFAFTEEYSSVLLFCLVFVTASAAVATNSHIKMTFFTEKMSLKNQKRAELLGAVAVIICFGVTVYYGGLMAWDSYQFGETSKGIGHPMWWYLIWLPIICLLGMVRAMGSFYRICSVKVN